MGIIWPLLTSLLLGLFERLTLAWWFTSRIVNVENISVLKINELSVHIDVKFLL
jgi:hypothetical protein